MIEVNAETGAARNIIEEKADTFIDSWKRGRIQYLDKTDEIIDNRFLMLSYPSRWRYDILRALDYFREASNPYDLRMQPALEVLKKKLKTK